MQKEDIKKLIIAMFFLWSVPTIIPYKWQLGAGNTTCFFMLYVIIYYIRKFSPKWAEDPKFYKSVVIGGYCLAFLSIILLDFLGNHVKSINDYACYFIRGDWRLLPVIISIGLFLWFTHCRIRYSWIINKIGSLTFAVYLIHMHPLMIDFLFNKTFSLKSYMESCNVVWYTICVTLLVFTFCILIEQVRKAIYDFIAMVIHKQINIKM